MRLSEFDNEQVFDILADLLEPVSEIVSDPVSKNLFNQMSKEGRVSVRALKPLLKEHKRALITILALLDGKDPETYKVHILTLPLKLLEILNDPVVTDLFTSQGQTMENPVSGSATGNIEANDK